MATNENNDDTLVKLSDTGETIKLGDEDIRTYSVMDKDGHRIGKVHDLLIDPKENTVRFMVVESGGFLGMGEAKSFIPIDAITGITLNQVHINQTRERVAGAPAYDPELVTTRDYHQNSYNYYGFAPYWMGGYSYPGFPFRVSAQGSEPRPHLGSDETR